MIQSYPHLLVAHQQIRERIAEAEQRRLVAEARRARSSREHRSPRRWPRIPTQRPVRLAPC